MKDVKVPLICTLKNEESSVKEFLDSLLSNRDLQAKEHLEKLGNDVKLFDPLRRWKWGDRK